MSAPNKRSTDSAVGKDSGHALWLEQLGTSSPVAQAILILCMVSVTGLGVASLRFRGIGMGSAGVLFSGLIFGHLGWNIDGRMLAFVQDFGLILFVFTIGLQIGPGFFASLRRQGLGLNACAAAIVLLGAGLAALTIPFLGTDAAAAAGLFSGATTNTPSLGAAQQAAAHLATSGSQILAEPALAYAVAYPGGVFGIIGCLLLLRRLFRIDDDAELAAFEKERRKMVVPILRRSLEVTNWNLNGLRVREIPGLRSGGVTVSRLLAAGSPESQVASDDAVVHVGDVLLAIGTAEALQDFQRVVGKAVDIDLVEAKGRTEFRHLLVTRREILGRSLRQLALGTRCGVVVTRIVRGGVEITASADFPLEFGDSLQVVGGKRGLDQAAELLGNSAKDLNRTDFLPIFAGIAAGVIAGMVPIMLPGLPVPVRLGLAGGPLVAAILLSRLGRIGRLVWYMPVNANLALRELGIVLFLACIGLKAGGRFMDTLLSHDGILWFFGGLAITVLPLIVVGAVARLALKMNFVVLSGLVAGSMTDPPALAFANSIAKSDAPSVAYATVYPLTMLLRILCAQFLILFLG